MTDKKQTVLVSCPRCGIKVAAQIIAEGKDTWKSPEGDSVKSMLAKCTNNECGKEFLVDSYFSLSTMSQLDTISLLKTMRADNSNKKYSWNKCYPLEHSPNCPKHLPSNVEIAYNEGAMALMYSLPNAAGVMFGRALELATQAESLLNQIPENQQNKFRKQNLYHRIEMLKNSGIITNLIFELADAIRIERNSAAHESSNFSMDEASKLKSFLDAFFGLVFTIQYNADSVRRNANQSNLK